MEPRHELPFHGSGRQVSNHIWEEIKTQDNSILTSTSVPLMFFIILMMFFIILLFQMVCVCVCTSSTDDFAFLINVINIYNSITGINTDRL